MWQQRDQQCCPHCELERGVFLRASQRHDLPWHQRYFLSNRHWHGAELSKVQGGSALVGQTGNSLILNNLSAADAGSYSVVVNGTCDSVVRSSTILSSKKKSLPVRSVVVQSSKYVDSAMPNHRHPGVIMLENERSDNLRSAAIAGTPDAPNG